jgi:hypothetical protein
MGKVTADITMSLDGFIAGPNDGPGNGAPVLLGSGKRLFENMGSDQITLEPTRAVGSPAVAHLKYRVVK